MKRLIVLVAILLVAPFAHAFSPVRYVQISTNTLTMQSGTAVVAGVTASTMTVSSATLTNVAISSMTSTLPMSARKITGLANGTASTDAAAIGQLHYTQTPVQFTTFTSSNTTSSTYISSNLTASITPTSVSHKIKVTAVFTAKLSSGAADAARFSIFRGSTNLGPAVGMVTLQVGSAVDQLIPCTLTFIDSPGSTSSTPYTIKFSNTNGVATVGVGSDFSSDQEIIILEEVI